MRGRLAAFVAVVVAVAGATVAPAGAGASAALTAVVACTEPGTVTVTWTIENLTMNENSTGLGGRVGTAELSGVATGDIADSFVPNPFNFDDRFIVGSNTVPGELVGSLTLDVEIFFTVNGPFDFSYETATTVELDGTCVAPAGTTPATAAPAVAARPTFTG